MLRRFLRAGGWFALVPLAIAALALIASLLIGADADAIGAKGEWTRAQVIAKEELTTPRVTSGTVRRASNFTLTVRFPTGSATAGTLGLETVTHFADEDLFRSVAVGDTLDLRYLPDDPQVIEFAAGDQAANAAAAGWVALGMAGLGVLTGWLIWARVRSEARIEREGIRVTATVETIERAGHLRVLHLAYLDATGQRVAATSQPLKTSQSRDVAVGDRIDVLADPRNPARVLALRRPDDPAERARPRPA